MRKTYISINDIPDTQQTIILYNNNLVVFNIKGILQNTDKKIIKIDIDWDVQDNFISDYNISYKNNKVFRGNMLNIIKSEDNIPITSFFTHEYKLDYDRALATSYITNIRFYYLDGTYKTLDLKITFRDFAFFDICGNINILNSQFVLNDYNYVLLTTETNNNYIVNYCLKQLANRGNAISSKIKTGTAAAGLVYDNQIVLRSNPLVYITTLNGNPLYVIGSPDSPFEPDEDEDIDNETV